MAGILLSWRTREAKTWLRLIRPLQRGQIRPIMFQFNFYRSPASEERKDGDVALSLIEDDLQTKAIVFLRVPCSKKISDEDFQPTEAFVHKQVKK